MLRKSAWQPIFTAMTAATFCRPCARDGSTRSVTEGLLIENTILRKAKNVVRRYAVGVQHAAFRTAMDDRPFAAGTHPNRNRFHQAAAIAGTVAGCDVHVETA